MQQTMAIQLAQVLVAWTLAMLPPRIATDEYAEATWPDGLETESYTAVLDQRVRQSQNRASAARDALAKAGGGPFADFYGTGAHWYADEYEGMYDLLFQTGHYLRLYGETELLQERDQELATVAHAFMRELQMILEDQLEQAQALYTQGVAFCVVLVTAVYHLWQ